MPKPDRLLGCPFCGEQPEIIDREVDFTPPSGMSFSYASAKGKSIACTNKMCGMQPATHPCPEENLFLFEKNWNMRPK